MGQKQLGRFPETAAWRAIVELIAGGADASVVADSTIAAARQGLDVAKRDTGVHAVVWQLAKLVLAARAAEPVEALRRRSIHLDERSTVSDLVADFCDVCDTKLTNTGRTDITEMAQLSAVEALTKTVPRYGDRLFSGQDIIGALRKMSTVNGFSVLSQEFFSRFVDRFLTYHLSRELSSHVGQNQRFADPRECSAFLDAIRRHSEQIAVVLQQFAGRSFSNRTFESGFTQTDARDFSYGAIAKLSQMLVVPEGEPCL